MPRRQFIKGRVSNCEAFQVMTKVLRIAIPIHSLQSGGVERVALGLATQWRQAGHEVTVILGTTEGTSGLCSAPALDYWRVPTRFSTAAWETPWMVHCLYSYLLRNKADVVFCPGNTYAVIGAAMKLLLGPLAPPMVLKISNALSRPDMIPIMARGYGWWLRAHKSVFDTMVALSEPMRQEALRTIRCEAGQVRVIPNPIVTRQRLDRLAGIERRADSAPASIPATRYLAAGRLVSQKNYPLLLRAFARSARPADTLTIAGEGPELARLRALAGRLGIAAQVHFLGHVPTIDDLLADADCLVLSSTYEGLPGVVVEALAGGLPVLATDCCVSMASLIEHGRTGLIVEPGCEDSFAAGLIAIRGLRGDPEHARALASSYEVEAAAQRYIDLLRDVVRHREQERRRSLALSACSRA